jgi:hypothetical protein
MGSLKSLLSSSNPNMPEIERLLDSLSPGARNEEALSLGRREQSRLFTAAASYRPISLANIVADDIDAQTEVVHKGINTMPAFRRFAKVFCRPNNGSSEQLWGYNRTPPFIGTAVGPGYFVAVPYGDREVLVDYLQLPEGKLPHWPKILPNSARLSRFVYNGTQDVLRGVSKHVTIGRAMKKGKYLPAWFVLCRQD